MTKRGVFLVCLLVASLAWRANAAQAAVLNRDTARGFAALAINCVHREFPNKITHVLFSVSDVAPPHILTPAFFGCFDWHSAVHAHWLLARLARKFPQAEFATIARSVLNIDLRPKNIAAEARYLKPRQGFERPYGLAWLLQLDSELLDWPDADAQRWHEALRPLVAVAVAHISDWLPKLDHPIRIGEHAQTAFALGLARDWAVAAGDTRFLRLIDQRARYYYAGDIRCPLRYEPSGHDFLPPCTGVEQRRISRLVEWFLARNTPRWECRLVEARAGHGCHGRQTGALGRVESEPCVDVARHCICTPAGRSASRIIARGRTKTCCDGDCQSKWGSLRRGTLAGQFCYLSAHPAWAGNQKTFGCAAFHGGENEMTGVSRIITVDKES